MLPALQQADGNLQRTYLFAIFGAVDAHGYAPCFRIDID